MCWLVKEHEPNFSGTTSSRIDVKTKRAEFPLKFYQRNIVTQLYTGLNVLLDCAYGKYLSHRDRFEHVLRQLCSLRGMLSSRSDTVAWNNNTIILQRSTSPYGDRCDAAMACWAAHTTTELSAAQREHSPARKDGMKRDPRQKHSVPAR